MNKWFTEPKSGGGSQFSLALAPVSFSSTATCKVVVLNRGSNKTLWVPAGTGGPKLFSTAWRQLEQEKSNNILKE